MATKHGPRVIVAFGKDPKTKKATYVRMTKSVAEYFGFQQEKKVPTRKSSKGRIIPVPGSVGAGSIKVPSGKFGKAGADKVKSVLYKSIPVPSGATLPQIEAFLKKATKNKPESFVSRDGRSWPIAK